jgi:hypothetical protein
MRTSCPIDGVTGADEMIGGLGDDTYCPVLIVVFRTQNINNCNDSFVLCVF